MAFYCCIYYVYLFIYKYFRFTSLFHQFHVLKNHTKIYILYTNLTPKVSFSEVFYMHGHIKDVLGIIISRLSFELGPGANCLPPPLKVKT